MKKNDPFPYEVVYEHFARRALEVGLPPNAEHPPMLLLVKVAGDKLVDIETFPDASVFFVTGERGKAILGRFLRGVVPTLPSDVCLVLISEAYTRKMVAEPGDSPEKIRAQAPADLSQDPEAIEVLSFQIYRPGAQRVGYLPIGPGRTLQYKPLEDPHAAIHGRLAAEPTRPDYEGKA